jgi:regulatory protein
MKRIDTSELSMEEQKELAWDKLLRSCSVREQSSAKMRHKLLDAGFSTQIVEETLNRALDLRFIDDRRYCECLIRSALSQNKGLRLILPEIKLLGIDPESLEAYVDYMSRPQEDVLETALDLLRRHPPRGKDVRASAFRKLVSKGYEISIASKAVSVYMDELTNL